MDYQDIRVTRQDGYTTITMNRPDVMNALNTQMRAELLHAFKDAARVSRAIVLTGEGKAFCSGQDLGDRATVASSDLERTLRDEYVPLLRAIFDSPVPTISAVNGAAAGAGANLALAADVVIATESAAFLQAFEQARSVPAPATHFLHILVELIDQRGNWQACTNLIRGRQADRQILAHPVHGKPVVPLIIQHGFVPVDHLPAARRTAADDIDHRAPVETGLFGKVQSFGQPLDKPRDADLIDHLGQLPRAAFA